MNSYFPLLTASILSVHLIASGATPETNYDESKAGSYTLPDPLRALDATVIETAKAWQKKRRPEVLKLFQTHVYGQSPGRPRTTRYLTRTVETQALSGKATRKEITLLLDGTEEGPRIDLLLYLPHHAPRPVPAFLGLNFFGNATVDPSPAISLSPRWVRPNEKMGIVNNRATEKSRGRDASRWPIELALDRGYAVATFYYGDIEPDHREGWKEGVRGYYVSKHRHGMGPDDWGAIGAWAWGLSRTLDYLETEAAVNSRQVAVFGHSRQGKTALWAGAQDERFALVISNDSGEGGASLARRNYGERISDLVRAVPYWFCPNYARYAGRESDLPVDQHLLIALAAPRPVYVASAKEDGWADPQGEFLALFHAEPVWRLFRLPGLGTQQMPPLDQPVGHTLGYHIRSGEHDITAYDWTQYLNFADRQFKRQTSSP